jgi:hypothetical protein
MLKLQDPLSLTLIYFSYRYVFLVVIGACVRYLHEEDIQFHKYKSRKKENIPSKYFFYFLEY